MISLKLTENVKKTQFQQSSPTGIHVDPYYTV